MNLYIIGAGGLGREVAAIARSMDDDFDLFFLDDTLECGRIVDGIKVIDSCVDFLRAGLRDGMLAMGIGNVSVKRRIFESAKEAGFSFTTLVDPLACVRGDARLGEGVVIAPGAVVSCAAEVGDNSLINVGALVGHDVVIGAHCALDPKAAILGGCSIGDEVEIGTGAQILLGLSVVSGSTVGMGASVFRNIEKKALVVGNPARAMPTQIHKT
jgi:sugar O-acyltransferase (sialic acid O-acetyltransferase NeuD family)